MMVDAGVVIAEILLDLHAMRSQYREATDNLHQAVTFIKSAYASDLHDYDGENVQHIIDLIVERNPNITLRHQHHPTQPSNHFEHESQERQHKHLDVVAIATEEHDTNVHPTERRKWTVSASPSASKFSQLVDEAFSSSSSSSQSASPPSERTKPPWSLITTAAASFRVIDHLTPLKDNYENRITATAYKSSSTTSPLPGATAKTWSASIGPTTEIERRIVTSPNVVANGNASSKSFDPTSGTYANERRDGDVIGVTSPGSISGVTDVMITETNDSNSGTLDGLSSATNSTTEFHHAHFYSYADRLLKIAHIFHFVSIAILGIFVVQVCLKLGGMGCEFFKKKIEIFDAVIVLTSFGLDLAFMEGVTQTQGEEAIALLIIFLLWRILRVINGIMVTTKKRQEFRIQLQKRARRRAEKKIEYLEDDKNWKDREITNLKRLCVEKGAVEEEIAGCKPRRRTIFQKMDTSMGLSSIASLSLGLSMSMTGTAGGAIMMRNFGAGCPFAPGGGPSNSAAARRLGLPSFRNNCMLPSPNQRRQGGQPTTPTSGEKSTTPEVVHMTVTAETNIGGTIEQNSSARLNPRSNHDHGGADNAEVDHVGVNIELVGRQERCPTFDGPDVIIIHESRIPSAGNGVGKQFDIAPSAVSNSIPFVVSDSLVLASSVAQLPPRPAAAYSIEHDRDAMRFIRASEYVLSPPTISICSPPSGESSDNDDVIVDDDDSDVVDVFSCSSSEESLSRVLSGTQLSVEPYSYCIRNGGTGQPHRRRLLEDQRRSGRDGGLGYGHVVSSSSSYLDQRSRRFVRRCFGGRRLKGIWGTQGDGRAASMSERPLTEPDHSATWDKRTSLTY